MSAQSGWPRWFSRVATPRPVGPAPTTSTATCARESAGGRHPKRAGSRAQPGRDAPCSGEVPWRTEAGAPPRLRRERPRLRNSGACCGREWRLMALPARAAAHGMPRCPDMRSAQPGGGCLATLSREQVNAAGAMPWRDRPLSPALPGADEGLAASLAARRGAGEGAMRRRRCVAEGCGRGGRCRGSIRRRARGLRRHVERVDDHARRGVQGRRGAQGAFAARAAPPRAAAPKQALVRLRAR